MLNLSKSILSVLLIIIALTFVIPHLSLDFFPDSDDSAEYYLRAIALSNGLGYVALEDAQASPFITFTTPPLLPHLLAVPALISGGSIAVVKVFFYILQLLAIFSIYRLYRYFFSRNTALALTILIVLSPVLLEKIGYIMTDLLSLGILAAILQVFLRMEESTRFRSFKTVLLAGIFTGLVVALRYGNLGIVLSGGVWFFYRLFGNSTNRYSWNKSLTYYSGLVIIAISLLLWIWIQGKDFFTDYIYYHLHYYNADKPSIPFFRKLFSFDYYFLKYFLSFSRLIITDYPLLKQLCTILLIPVIFGLKGLQSDMKKQLIICFLVFTALPYIISTNTNSRYALPTLMLLLIVTVWGLENLQHYINSLSGLKKLKHWLNLRVIFICCGFLWFLSLQSDVFSSDKQDTHAEWENLKNAQQLVKSVSGELPEGSVILSTCLDYRLVRAHSGYPSFRMQEHPEFDSTYTVFENFMDNFEHTFLLQNSQEVAAARDFEYLDLLILNRDTNVLLEIKRKSFPQAQYIWDRLTSEERKGLEKYELHQDVKNWINGRHNDFSKDEREILYDGFTGRSITPYLEKYESENFALARSIFNLIQEGFYDPAFYDTGTDWHLYWLTEEIGRYFLMYQMFELWKDRNEGKSVRRVDKIDLYKITDPRKTD